MSSPKDSRGARSGRSSDSLLLGDKHRVKEHPGFRRPSSWSGPHRILNRRLLLLSILFVALIVPMAYFWHQWQVQSSASAMLLHVDKLAAEGKTVEATLQLQRYAELVGTEDLDTLLRMVDLLQKSDPQTINIMRHEARYQRRIIDMKPTLTQNRRRLAELLFAIGSYSLAADEARVLLREDKNDTIALRVLANSHYGRQEFPQALAAYRQAVKVNPSDITSYARMANCYMRTGDEKLAAGVIDEMVARNPKSGEALFRRYMFRRAIAPSTAVATDLETALSLEKNNREILLEAANYALQSGNVPLAKERYGRLIELSTAGEGQWILGYLGLANASLAARDPAGAVEALKEAIASQGTGDSFQLNYRLVEAMLEAKDIEEIPGLLKRLRDHLSRLSTQKGRRPDEMVAAERSVDLLEAKYHMAGGEPRKAIPLLREASRTDFGNPAVTLESLQLLGELYTQFEEWDAAAEVLQRAAISSPDNQVTRFLLARSLAQSGRIDEALGIFTVLAQNEKAPPLVWLSLAQLNYRKQLGLAPAARNWQPFQRSLEGCMKHGVGLVDIALLRTSYLASTGQTGEAFAALLATEVTLAQRYLRETFISGVNHVVARLAIAVGRPPEKYRKMAERPWADVVFSNASSRVWIGAMELLSVADFSTLAQWMAGIGVRVWPDSLSIVLAAANLQAGDGQVEEAIQTINAGLENVDKEAHLALLRTKSRLLSQIDDLDRLITVRLELAEKEPDNLDNLISLCEDLTRARRFEEAAKYVDIVKRAEGDDGTNWRYALAILKLAQQETASEALLQEAAGLSQEILTKRPTWSRGQLLGALVAIQQDNPDRAVEFYKRAIQYGDRRPDVYRQLLKLLVSRGELREAEQFLADLKAMMASDATIVPIALQLTASRRDFAQAEALAVKNVQERPEDARAHLWLADVYALRGKHEEAVASYRKAIELDPKDLDGYINLVRLYAQLDDLEAGRKVTAELEQSPALTDRGDLVLGYLYSVLGEKEDLERAKDHYVAATKKLSGDSAALRASIEFFVRNGLPEAEPALKQLEIVDAQDPYLRRARALWKSTLPDAGSWQEALELMADQTSSDDLRVRSLLLERMRGPDQIREAIRLLEMVAGRANEVTPNDRYRLAKLYQIDGKLENAIGHLSSIVFEETADPEYIRSCLELMLQAGRWQGEPEVLLKRLETREPDSMKTKSLRARWLYLAGRQPEAIAYVKDVMAQEKGNPKYSEILLACGRLLSQFGQIEDAEKAYRTLEQYDPTTGYQHLAVFLVNQGRGDEAVKICLDKYEQLGVNGGQNALRRAANISGLAPVSAELEERIDTLLARACKDPAEELAMSRVIAERRLRKGKYQDAIKFYKRSLAANPNNPTDLNNYALALSKLGQSSEALQLIDQAIALAGPRLELLDTKGMILLDSDNVNAALDIFHKVTTDARASAVNYLHLSYACKRANRVLEMRTALDRAREREINVHSLSEDDRRIYAELSGLEGTTT